MSAGMDSGGMLLNFDLSAPLVLPSTKTKLVGGSWKARQAAQKASRGIDRHDAGSDANRVPIGQRRQTDWDQSPSAGVHGENYNENKSRDERGGERRWGQVSDETADQTNRARSGRPRRDIPAGFVTDILERQSGLRPEPKEPMSGPKRVISSLFSRPPKRRPTDDKGGRAAGGQDDGEAVVFAPSNAPLLDEAASFGNLGLSAVIANHLVAKMGIKAPTEIQKRALQQIATEQTDNSRDVFIQAETGSGKTLAYLLPIVDRMLAIRTGRGRIGRENGLFAIVLAPTRELCRQISDVLDKLLRCAVYLVAGSVNGGENKQKEKARLRKGLNVLVATPGRLSDHLDNTKVLDVSVVRWLVLDEGDRMMEMGFEADIRKLVSRLDAAPADRPTLYGLPTRRMTVLCSATMRMGALKLGAITLKDAVHIDVGQPTKTTKSGRSENSRQPSKDDDGGGIDGADTADADTADPAAEQESQFQAPAQLQQWYVATPPKLRLVTLVGLLRRAVALGSRRMMVFFSCADSVDFHFSALTRTVAGTGRTKNDHRESAVLAGGGPVAPTETSPTFLPAPSLAAAVATGPDGQSRTGAPIVHRLHGSLPHPLRRATLANFARPRQTGPADDGAEPVSIMFTTDLSSRGLDLPDVDLVVEVDPAFSAAEHVHRIGRTARAGRDGRAVVILTRDSAEMEYVNILQACLRPGQKVKGEQAEEVVKIGFGILDPGSGPGGRTLTAVTTMGSGSGDAADWETQATTFQLAVERWVLDPRNRNSTAGPSMSALDLAKNAFQSHVRAYATHVGVERVFFNIKSLHLGHLCKAFGLRVAPAVLGSVGQQHHRGETKKGGKSDKKGVRKEGKTTSKRKVAADGCRDDEPVKRVRRSEAGNGDDDGPDSRDGRDGRDGRERMAMAMKALQSGGLDEFNLG